MAEKLPNGRPADPETLKVSLDEIKLPPPEIVAEMLADESDPPAADIPQRTVPAPGAAAPAAKAPPPVEQLDFLPGKVREVTVPLDYPFRWNGAEVREVTVRRLSTGEIGAVLDAAGETYTLYDIYAAMTGLPAAVLRGMDDDDNARVLEVAGDFLPLGLRAARG